MRVVDHYTRPLADGRILCEVCPRACKIGPGQRGLCYVRQNVDGHMVLTTDGLSSGFCVDPIEKKPLFHFLPGSSVLSFGTAGCNLACAFCQNHEISKSREVETSAERASPEAIARAASRARLRLGRLHLQRSRHLLRIRDRRRRRLPCARASRRSR